MIIKLDLANAFERVCHDFIFQVMQKLGFTPAFVNWAKAYIGSPWIAPLVNGRASGFFQAWRGLWQGCPLSPLLYAIQASVLSFQLEHCRLQKNLIGLRIVQGVKDLNHAQFSDDTLLLGGASIIISRKFKKELDVCKTVSGSQINNLNRKIYGWNCSPREMLDIIRILEMEGFSTWDSFKYLGVPIFKFTPMSSNWLPIIEKLKKKNHAWGALWLNLACKFVLIKSVLLSIHIYQSTLLLSHKSFISKVDTILRHFLWEGGKQNEHRLHLVS